MTTPFLWFNTLRIFPLGFGNSLQQESVAQSSNLKSLNYSACLSVCLLQLAGNGLLFIGIHSQNNDLSVPRGENHKPMSTYPNSWKPYVPRAINVKEVLAKKVEEYDQNFCLPGAVRDIENDRVKLTPFVPSLHARTYFEAFKSHPETFQFYPIGPFADLDSVVVYIERYCQQLPTALLYTIWDKTKPIVDESDPSAVPRYEMAGTIGIRNAQPANMSLEIGHLLIFPTFRRTHVTSNAIGLLALFCFSDAETEGGGLRMRRVQWQSHTSNAASIRAAKRFGFVEEGVARWQLIVHAATEGRWRPGDEACSWDSMVLSLCWDEVDYGLIRSIMDRRE